MIWTRNLHRLIIALTFMVAAATARADAICTLLLDVPTGAIVLKEGDCRTRITPASTFKIPLAVMAYDAGLLTDPQNPTLEYRTGDPDWGGDNWRRNTNPSDWLRYSVVWYSQRLTHAMGSETLTRYTESFGYGNADFSGDRGFDNGLDRAWIASSLAVSPLEQAAFLRALILDALPVSFRAMQNAREIVERRQIGDWTIHGKTGTAYPRRADRSFDYARGWGWYLGWAQNDDRKLVFVRLTQASERAAGSPGNLTRDALLEEWADLID